MFGDRNIECWWILPSLRWKFLHEEGRVHLQNTKSEEPWQKERRKLKEFWDLEGKKAEKNERRNLIENLSNKEIEVRTQRQV
jgi:hypothetical protein